MRLKTIKTKIYSVKGAADRMGWARHTLAKAARLGLIPYHTRPSGTMYFSEEDMNRIEEACTHENSVVYNG